MVQEALRRFVSGKFRTLSIRSDGDHAPSVERFVEDYINKKTTGQCLVVDGTQPVSALFVAAESGAVLLFRQPVSAPDRAIIDELVSKGAAVIKVASSDSDCIVGSELLQLFGDSDSIRKGSLTFWLSRNYDRVALVKDRLVRGLKSRGVDVQNFEREIQTTDEMFQYMLDLFQPDEPQHREQPEVWSGVDRSGDPILFLRKNYGELIRDGKLTRASLRDSAPKLMKALEAWCRHDDTPQVGELFKQDGRLDDYEPR